MIMKNFFVDNYNNCMGEDKVTKNYTLLMKVYFTYIC